MSLVSNSGTRGLSNISSDPTKDPAFVGTLIRIGVGGTAYALGRLNTTYGDPARDGSGQAATGLVKAFRDNIDVNDRGYQNRNAWKDNQGREPYVDNDGLPLSKWLAGVKVIDSLTMVSPSYTTTDDQGNDVEIGSVQMEIQNIMMNVSQKKNLVRKRIAGRDGQVTQYINMDDYVVDCWGRILGYEGLGGFVQGERPEEAIRQFIQFMERPTQVEVACDFLNIVGVERAIISDFKLTQEIGKLDHQAFKFKMYSDKPFEIFVEDRIPQ